ncbi:MAG: hypothetical protein OXG78_10265 [Chloroflexi bacterium]|nr:hypothetical protein [Chloroflexota bacterium]
MWRLVPLGKMTLRMFFFSAAIFTISHGLIYYLFLDAGQNLSDFFALALHMARWSVIPALVLALPLPVVTVIFFREIRRPAFYRYTMLTVALVASIAVWSQDYVTLGQLLRYGDSFAGYAAAIIAANALAIFVSYLIAGRYLREAAEQARERSKVS